MLVAILKYEERERLVIRVENFLFKFSFVSVIQYVQMTFNQVRREKVADKTKSSGSLMLFHCC